MKRSSVLFAGGVGLAVGLTAATGAFAQLQLLPLSQVGSLLSPAPTNPLNPCGIGTRGGSVLNGAAPGVGSTATGALGCGPPSGGSQRMASISDLSAVANPREYKGKCPGTVEFIGTVITAAATRISYRWERDDGSASQVYSALIDPRNPDVQTVIETGRPGELVHGVEVLHVLSPVNVRSNRAKFTVACH